MPSRTGSDAAITAGSTIPRGACIEQPFEDTAEPAPRFRDKIRIKSYPVEEKAGMLWAYLGPEPSPLVPSWEPFTWANGFR